MDLIGKNYLPLIVFLLLLNLTLPSFVYSSIFRKTPDEEIFETQGHPLILPCITEKKDVRCVWMFNNTVMYPKEGYDYVENTSTGDCTLTIRKLEYPRDEAIWTCQVPSLESPINWPKTKVVVLVKPSPPRFVPEELENITADRVSTLVCESSGGNPKPSLEWHLNDKNITLNATSIAHVNRVTSTLNYIFKKQNNASSLTCRSVHRLGDQSFKRHLNVLYKPIVHVEHKMYTILENHHVDIECQVDANPLPNTFWKPIEHITEKNYKVYGNKLSVFNVTRQNDGAELQCSAQNSIGVSEPVSVKINVNYPPNLENISEGAQIEVGNDLSLLCKFSGNPTPLVRWNFVGSLENEPIEVASGEKTLLIKNASYLNEGGYYCVGENVILGETNIRKSNKIEVNIVGRPQFLNDDKTTLVGYIETDTRIERKFCSDPPPTDIHWLYEGSIQHKVNLNWKNKQSDFSSEFEEGTGHITASPLIPLDLNSPKPTCFKVALLIRNTDIADRRDYSLIVKNDKYGVAEEIITLKVESKVSGAVMISISLIVLIMLFVLTVVFILFLRRRSNNSKRDDSEDKSDVRVPINDSSDATKRSDEKVH